MKHFLFILFFCPIVFLKAQIPSDFYSVFNPQIDSLVRQLRFNKITYLDIRIKKNQGSFSIRRTHRYRYTMVNDSVIKCKFGLRSCYYVLRGDTYYDVDKNFKDLKSDYIHNSYDSLGYKIKYTKYIKENDTLPYSRSASKYDSTTKLLIDYYEDFRRNRILKYETYYANDSILVNNLYISKDGEETLWRSDSTKTYSLSSTLSDGYNSTTIYFRTRNELWSDSYPLRYHKDYICTKIDVYYDNDYVIKEATSLNFDNEIYSMKVKVKKTPLQ